MMNGTVTPSVVVVSAIWPAAGGLAGSYGWKALPPPSLPLTPGRAAPLVGAPLGRYRNLKVGAWLHWASSAPSGQDHGWVCGPAKTGPPMGWLTSVSRAALPWRTRAVSLVRPTRRPSTTPSSVRGPDA